MCILSSKYFGIFQLPSLPLRVSSLIPLCLRANAVRFLFSSVWEGEFVAQDALPVRVHGSLRRRALLPRVKEPGDADDIS